MNKLDLYNKAIELRRKNYRYTEISDMINVNRRTIMDWCKGKVDPKKLKGVKTCLVSDENFLKFIKNSFSVSQVLKKCGLKPRGGNYRIFYNRAKKLNADTSHFIGQGHLKGKKNKYVNEIPIEEAFVENGSLNSFRLSKKIQKYNLLEYKCAACDIKGEWNGQPISLHLDHINGINNDNRLENLRFLCPNCHSQTSTYCGKNK